MPVELTRKKIRARVTSSFGVVETPYILSFYVSKNRNQLDSFNCSLKISNNSGPGETGDKITIEAGVDSPEHVVFCGYITSIKVRPSFEDPSFHIIDLSGTDARKFLEDKKVTRRQTMEKRSWAEITGVQRRALRSSKLKYTRRTDFVDSAFPAPADQDSSEASTSNEDAMDVLDQASITRESGKAGRGAVEFYSYFINTE